MGIKNTFLIEWRRREEFWQWCLDAGTTPEFRGTTEFFDIWAINDDEVVLLAKLRWA
jgi:hypothetical protein